MKWEEGAFRAEDWGEEKELVEKGREEVGDTRGRACLAVTKDIPKLRGSSGYTTTKLSPHHTGKGNSRWRSGGGRRSRCRREGRRWGTPGGLSG